MTCPECRKLLHEDSPLCPHCGFGLGMADSFFGLAPELEPHITDLAEVLSQRRQRRLYDAIKSLGRRFPQVSFYCVITRLPSEVQLGPYGFWLLNRGGLAATTDKGGACRVFLILIDVTDDRVACTIGYGLEPFVPQKTLEEIAKSAGPFLEKHDYSGAVIGILQSAESALSAIVESIPEGFGLNLADARSTSEADVYAY